MNDPKELTHESDANEDKMANAILMACMELAHENGCTNEHRRKCIRCDILMDATERLQVEGYLGDACAVMLYFGATTGGNCATPAEITAALIKEIPQVHDLVRKVETENEALIDANDLTRYTTPIHVKSDQEILNHGLEAEMTRQFLDIIIEELENPTSHAARCDVCSPLVPVIRQLASQGNCLFASILGSFALGGHSVSLGRLSSMLALMIGMLPEARRVYALFQSRNADLFARLIAKRATDALAEDQDSNDE